MNSIFDDDEDDNDDDEDEDEHANENDYVKKNKHQCTMSKTDNDDADDTTATIPTITIIDNKNHRFNDPKYHDSCHINSTSTNTMTIPLLKPHEIVFNNSNYQYDDDDDDDDDAEKKNNDDEVEKQNDDDGDDDDDDDDDDAEKKNNDDEKENDDDGDDDDDDAKEIKVYTPPTAPLAYSTQSVWHDSQYQPQNIHTQDEAYAMPQSYSNHGGDAIHFTPSPTDVHNADVDIDDDDDDDENFVKIKNDCKNIRNSCDNEITQKNIVPLKYCVTHNDAKNTHRRHSVRARRFCLDSRSLFPAGLERRLLAAGATICPVVSANVSYLIVSDKKRISLSSSSHDSTSKNTLIKTSRRSKQIMSVCENTQTTMKKKFAAEKRKMCFMKTKGKIVECVTKAKELNIPILHLNDVLSRLARDESRAASKAAHRTRLADRYKIPTYQRNMLGVQDYACLHSPLWRQFSSNVLPPFDFHSVSPNSMFRTQSAVNTHKIPHKPLRHNSTSESHSHVKESPSAKHIRIPLKKRQKTQWKDEKRESKISRCNNRNTAINTHTSTHETFDVEPQCKYGHECANEFGYHLMCISHQSSLTPTHIDVHQNASLDTSHHFIRLRPCSILHDQTKQNLHHHHHLQHHHHHHHPQHHHHHPNSFVSSLEPSVKRQCSDMADATNTCVSTITTASATATNGVQKKYLSRQHASTTTAATTTMHYCEYCKINVAELASHFLSACHQRMFLEDKYSSSLKSLYGANLHHHHHTHTHTHTQHGTLRQLLDQYNSVSRVSNYSDNTSTLMKMKSRSTPLTSNQYLSHRDVSTQHSHHHHHHQALLSPRLDKGDDDMPSTIHSSMCQQYVLSSQSRSTVSTTPISHTRTSSALVTPNTINNTSHHHHHHHRVMMMMSPHNTRDNDDE